MKRVQLIGIVAMALVLFFGGAVLAMNHAVKIAEKAGVGRYLTDAEGKTLYWFTKDSAGKSACAGPCVEKWPLYHRHGVAAPAGIPATDFGAITREDGKKQTTFRGYPLYYFQGDAKSGDTSGQGVNGVWFVVDPDNFPPKK